MTQSIPAAVDEPIAWNDYGGLRSAFNAWRERRNISFEELDELAGVPKGYSAKIFSPKGLRRIGMKSLLWYCDALGLNGELRHNAEAFERIKSRLNGRSRAQVRNGGAIRVEFTRRYMQKIGKKGGKVRMKNLLTKGRLVSNQKKAGIASANALGVAGRKSRAQHAAVVRWSDVKRAARGATNGA